jgi:addiction module HigA family antidote
VLDFMIRNFRSKALERLWTKNDPRGIRADHVAKVQLVLAALNASTSPLAMDRPSFSFHPLKGAMQGRYAVKVNKNWRITFAWDEYGPAAIDIDYEDYH